MYQVQNRGANLIIAVKNKIKMHKIRDAIINVKLRTRREYGVT